MPAIIENTDQNGTQNSAETEQRTGENTVLPGQSPQGAYILSVLLKRTYDIVPGRSCVRAAADQKINSGDVHHGDPMNSSVKLESDFIPYKLATDVVLNGVAHAPGNRPTESLTASLIVGDVRKDVRVIGDRACEYQRWSDPVFTDPEPFTQMEIRYENAYGGVDIRSQPRLPFPCGRNPLGRGFVLANKKRAVNGLRLPNIEDPGHLITPANLFAGDGAGWMRQPMPQGFGWFPKTWQPRASLAGVLPADRETERELRRMFAQLLTGEERKIYEGNPLPDIDFRFFNGASEGLALPFLQGDEEVQTTHLCPEGELSFELPGERPEMAIDIGPGRQELDVVLHTVMVRMEERQVDLVWRGATTYPGPDWLPEMKKMEVSIS